MGTGARQGHVCVSLCACVCARRPTRHVLFSPFLSLSHSLASTVPPRSFSLSLSFSRFDFRNIAVFFSTRNRLED